MLGTAKLHKMRQHLKTALFRSILQVVPSRRKTERDGAKLGNRQIEFWTTRVAIQFSGRAYYAAYLSR